jgi:hypothetical protein
MPGPYFPLTRALTAHKDKILASQKELGTCVYFPVPRQAELALEIVGQLRFPIEKAEFADGSVLNVVLENVTSYGGVGVLASSYQEAVAHAKRVLGIDGGAVDTYHNVDRQQLRIKIKCDNQGNPAKGDKNVLFVNLCSECIPTERFAVGDRIRVRLSVDSVIAYPAAGGATSIKLGLRTKVVMDEDIDPTVPSLEGLLEEEEEEEEATPPPKKILKRITPTLVAPGAPVKKGKA